MKEYSLHSEIKSFYALPGDRFEAKLGDYIVDILRGDMVIEVQTKNFSALKGKLRALTKKSRVRLVYPLPERKWITRVGNDHAPLNKRRSPRVGRLTDVFRELVMIPEMPGQDNFSMEILFIDEEEIRCADGKGSWRRRGVSTKDRRLLKVNERALFKGKADYLRLLPESLGSKFTNLELARLAGIPLSAARQITYCFRKSGFIRTAGTRGRAFLFEKVEP